MIADGSAVSTARGSNATTASLTASPVSHDRAAPVVVAVAVGTEGELAPAQPATVRTFLRSEAAGEWVAGATVPLPGAPFRSGVELPPNTPAIATATGVGIRDEARTEKIAGRARGLAERAASAIYGTVKTMEANIGQLVEKSDSLAGIGAAKSEAAMPFPPPDLVAPTVFSPAVSGQAGADSGVGEAPAQPELGTQAARAVEAVFTAAELAQRDGRNSVTLRFALGDADLSVRVEVRDDEVRATFATDSVELRAALSQECAAAADSSGRAFRFSAHVADQPAGAPFSGDSAFARREPHAPPSSPEMARLAQATRTNHDERDHSPVTVSAFHRHSVHLHTLA